MRIDGIPYLVWATKETSFLCAVGFEELYDLCVAALLPDLQRGLAVIGSGVTIGSLVQEPFHDVAVTSSDAIHECRPAFSVLCIDGRFFVEQQSNRFRLFSYSGPHEGGPAVSVPCVDIRSFLHEKVSRFQTPCRCGRHEGRAPILLTHLLQ